MMINDPKREQSGCKMTPQENSNRMSIDPTIKLNQGELKDPTTDVNQELNDLTSELNYRELSDLRKDLPWTKDSSEVVASS